MRHRSFRSRPAAPAAALITGASSGIGAAFAQNMPASTDLLLVARDAERLEQVAEPLRRDGRRVETLSADLGTKEGLAATVEAGEAFGTDLLVNNAGLGRLGTVLEQDADDLAQVIAVNVEAPVLLARALLPGMIERARGSGERGGLIMVASSAAFAPVPHFASYGASKAFLLSFSEALTAELSSQPVDVLTLCPGATRTSFGQRAGFSAGNFPGAVPPGRVARAALEALGRQPVLITGPERLALQPLARARAALARATGFVGGFAARRRG
jgi:hypothetical protein